LKHLIGVLLSASIMLTGCGTGQYISEKMGDVDNSAPPSPLRDIYTTIEITELWSDNIGSGTNELFIKLMPAIKEDKVFIANADGEVAALNVINGKTVWKKDIDLPITGGPGADDNLVMIGSSEGDIVSLSLETGEEIWRTKVSSEILSSPREGNGTVIVRTIDGKIFALNSETGDRLWVYDRIVPALTLRGTSTPVIVENDVIAGFDGGRVTSLNRATGNLNWETLVAISRGRSELERLVDIDSQPLIYQDFIYIATYQSTIAALSLQTGAVLWDRNISSYTELSANDNQLYVTDEEGNVWALDRFSGSTLWKQEKLIHRKLTGPAVFGNTVVVGDLEGYLHWLDRQTGEFIGRNQVSKSAILVRPTVVNNQLFAYASNGTLASYSYIDMDISKLPARPVITEIETEQVAEFQNIEDTEIKVEEPEEDSSLLDDFIDIFYW
jgi:outer membrane protein assembly factor BamB